MGSYNKKWVDPSLPKRDCDYGRTHHVPTLLRPLRPDHSRPRPDDRALQADPSRRAAGAIRVVQRLHGRRPLVLGGPTGADRVRSGLSRPAAVGGDAVRTRPVRAFNRVRVSTMTTHQLPWIGWNTTAAWITAA